MGRTRPWLDRGLLLGSILLLPAAEWFSLVNVPIPHVTFIDLTPPKIIAILLVPLVAFAVLSAPREIISPVPILVGLLATWCLIANTRRDSYGAFEFRSAVYFSAVSSTAFISAFFAAKRMSHTFGRYLVRVVALMLFVGTSLAIVEHLTVPRPEVLRVTSSPLTGLWEFFRPEVQHYNPVLGWVDVIRTHSFTSVGLVRVAGPFASFNLLADFIAQALALLALPLLMLAPRQSWRQRVAYAILILASMQTLIWTQSRAASLSLAFAAIVTLIASLRLRPRWVVRVVPIATVLLVVLGVMVAVDPVFRYRLTLGGLLGDSLTSSTSGPPSDVDRFAAEASIRSRLALFGLAVEMVSQDARSSLLGPGLQTFIAQVNSDPAHPAVEAGVGGPHNGYLTFVVAGGIPALLFFLGALTIPTVAGLRPLASRRIGKGGLIRAGVSMTLLSWVAIALVDTNPYSFPETVVLFTLIGALAGLNQSARSDSRPKGADKRFQDVERFAPSRRRSQRRPFDILRGITVRAEPEPGRSATPRLVRASQRARLYAIVARS